MPDATVLAAVPQRAGIQAHARMCILGRDVLCSAIVHACCARVLCWALIHCLLGCLLAALAPPWCVVVRAFVRVCGAV
jgi:hypothetical protein